MLAKPAWPDVPMMKRRRARAVCAAAAVLAAAAAAPVAAQQVVPPPPRLVEPDSRSQAADGSRPTAGQPAVAPAANRVPRRAAAAASAASAATPAGDRADARPHVKVVEDDNVRIEETRLRGQVQRITVQNKTGGTRDYEIIVTPGGKDTSQDRGAMGQRAWSLFAF